jgi:hypothetical protein
MNEVVELRPKVKKLLCKSHNHLKPMLLNECKSLKGSAAFGLEADNKSPLKGLLYKELGPPHKKS